MSPFLGGLITGVFLGTFAWAVLVVLLASHRAPPPTLHRRKFRDEPIPDGVDDPARVQEGAIDYRFLHMGVDGE
ncbi:hypothetical protein [Paraburkholderia tropica]|uniref:hypothetical protein n=1 Tax=Paraburkholderia tropica TaxID=92647 RepID=UPI000B279822|nr:hypothetical protein [Paraburkholderia tropica]